MIDKENELWVGSDEGLSVKGNQNFLNYSSKDYFSDAKVTALFKDKLLWIGTTKGLFYLQD